MAALLAVAGGDGGPGGAAAGVIDRVDHRLPPGQGDLELDPGDGGPVQLRDGPLRTLHPLVGDEPAVLLNLHGYIDNLAILGEGRSKEEPLMYLNKPMFLEFLPENLLGEPVPIHIDSVA